MTQNQDLRSRLTIGRKRDGRHECDESALQDLVELCLRPGVSGARMCQQRFQTDAPGSSFFASHLDAWNLVRANQAEIAACSEAAKPRTGKRGAALHDHNLAGQASKRLRLARSSRG